MPQHCVRILPWMTGPEPGAPVYRPRRPVASAPPCGVERGDGSARRKRASWAGAAMVLIAALLAPPRSIGAQSDSETGIPPLLAAVRAGDRGAVNALLAAGADVTAPQPDGATALHWAVHREDVETARALIRAGADVGAANDLGVTPLLMACRRGQGELAAQLLAAGADPTAALPSGETPLMAAARAGSLVAVEALLERGAPVNAAEATRGQTALMWAVANRRPSVTRTLLAHGADIAARTRTRRRVYNMGGSRSAGSASRGIALEEVIEGGSTALLFAVRSGDLESARLLVAAGADVHDTTADGNTALAIAAHSGHGSLAMFLLERGAAPNAAPLGYAPLHAAVLRGTLRDRGVRNDDPGAGVPLVRALLAHGADPDARLLRGTPVRRWSHDFAFMDRWVGATPFWLAAHFLEVEMMHVLAAAGADPRAPSRAGTTPLMAAAGLGYNRGGGSAFIRDRRDFSSYNPVESAALGSTIPAAEERRAREAVAVALDLGARVGAANDAGDTALHAAASHGMNGVIELLAARGADVRAANGRGQTPLDVAVYSDGIAGDRFVRESTAELLRSLEGAAAASPADAPAPAGQPVARTDHSPARSDHPPASVGHPAAPQAGALTNPVLPTPASVAAGASAYARYCASCHGTTGRGDGPLAAATAAYGVRPSNLADPAWQHGASDGEVFVAIRDGIGPDFAMDAFGARLTERDIWNVVNFLNQLP